jgi:hypothetical protein
MTVQKRKVERVYEALTAYARHFAESIPSPCNTMWLERLADWRQTAIASRDELADALAHVDDPRYRVYGALDRMTRFVVARDDTIRLMGLGNIRH